MSLEYASDHAHATVAASELRTAIDELVTFCVRTVATAAATPDAPLATLADL